MEKPKTVLVRHARLYAAHPRLFSRTRQAIEAAKGAMSVPLILLARADQPRA
jgi:hypothetical protein